MPPWLVSLIFCDDHHQRADADLLIQHLTLGKLSPISVNIIILTWFYMKKQLLNFIFFSVAVIFGASSACAGEYSGHFYIQMWNENIYITPTSDEQKSNVPACATRNLLRLQESPDTATYKKKMAALLATWLAGHSISLQGTGQCTSEGDEIIFLVTPQ